MACASLWTVIVTSAHEQLVTLGHHSLSCHGHVSLTVSNITSSCSTTVVPHPTTVHTPAHFRLILTQMFKLGIDVVGACTHDVVVAQNYKPYIVASDVAQETLRHAVTDGFNMDGTNDKSL